MSREKNQDQEAGEYGIFIESQRYILFSGTTYDPNDTSNLITEIDLPLTLSSTFANQTIVFAKGSGEIVNFVENQSSVVVVDSNSNQSKTFNFNPYGVPE
jgi:hypothetical protein